MPTSVQSVPYLAASHGYAQGSVFVNSCFVRVSAQKVLRIQQNNLGQLKVEQTSAGQAGSHHLL